MTLLSIIVPVYNEAANLIPLYEEVKHCCTVDFELIFVDDGSNDATFGIVESLAEKDNRVKCISLSRNFGHQHALMAGLHYASGSKIVIMDGDLQHPPSLIPFMLNQLSNGFDLVHTRRNNTKDIPLSKKIFTRLFYKFINTISDTRIEPNMADFKAFNRKVLDAILRFKERELFLRGIFSWIGFKTVTIDFDAPARMHGKTKYGFGSMFKLAVKGTISFGFKPLRIATIMGALLSLVAFCFAVFALVAYFKGETVAGWASTIIAVMLLGGTQLLAIGLIGEYIAGLFSEAKKRPLYLVDKTINISDPVVMPL